MTTPVPLPDGPMPKDAQEFLAAIQDALFGKRSEDAVRGRVCLHCDAAGIADRDFKSLDNMRWYFLFGVCQRCQDEQAVDVMVYRMIHALFGSDDGMEGWS